MTYASEARDIRPRSVVFRCALLNLGHWRSTVAAMTSALALASAGHVIEMEQLFEDPHDLVCPITHESVFQLLNKALVRKVAGFRDIS